MGEEMVKVAPVELRAEIKENVAYFNDVICLEYKGFVNIMFNLNGEESPNILLDKEIAENLHKGLTKVLNKLKSPAKDGVGLTIDPNKVK